MKKLQGQVDFLNKENDRLQRQVDILKGDGDGNLAAAQYEGMKRELDELAFENQTLKKDYNESTKLLRETQEKYHELMAEREERLQLEEQA